MEEKVREYNNLSKITLSKEQNLGKKSITKS